MGTAHTIQLEAEPKPGDVGVIVKGLTDYNALHAGGATPEYLVVSVRDSEGKVVGGLVGATYFGWLQVHSVWLREDLRGQGYGTSLMEAAEREATQRGCTRAFLETLSFQALPFYEKLGYSVFSRLPDFPPGGARYALTKTLSPTGSPSRS
jgi:GNAT superfamily N-acetyltransferase